MTIYLTEKQIEKINALAIQRYSPNEKIQTVSSSALNMIVKAVTIPSLTKSDLLNISIPLPPLALQNEFADFVALVDKSQFACEIAIKVWRNSLKFSII
ncbi:type I restriction-modification system, S subunit [Streptococcus pneumoniae]|nr:type I restriction-modification system, S subunit [Streptococcus pneumoniae]